MESRTQVVIAENDAGVRALVCRYLARHLDVVEVVGTAADGEEAVWQVRRMEPDVLLLDLVLPGLSGFDVIRRLRELGVSTRVVLLSGHADASTVGEAVRAGAAGFLDKADLKAVVPGVCVAACGGLCYSGRAAAHVADTLVGVGSEAAVGLRLGASVLGGSTGGGVELPELRLRLAELTPREQEVLGLIVHDRSPGEIAGDLGVRANTVHKHLQALRQKLGARGTAGLVVRALAAGFPVDL